MSDKVQKSVRVEPDLAEYIEQYCEENDVKDADAMRQLLRDGARYREELQTLARRLRQVEERLGSVEEHTEQLAEETTRSGLFG